jgi:DNA-binding protein YbaB
MSNLHKSLRNSIPSIFAVVANPYLRMAATVAVFVVAAGTAFSAEPSARYPAARRVVAIGDLHGDLVATFDALRLVGAIDEDWNWIGGELVVVQTGDQLDRGDQEQKIVDRFEELATEARAHGGAVHVLNGNHELMNVALDLRYVTPEGFADFEDATTVGKLDSTLAAHEPEQRARVAAFRPGGAYARRLASRPIAVIVGRTLFVHGSIDIENVSYGLGRINAEAQRWLLGEGPQPDWVNGEHSPVWSRRFSDEVDDEDCEILAEVLDRLMVDRMVVGHTVQEEGINSYCGPRVWCVDVGMAAAYGGRVEALEIVGDDVRVIHVADTAGVR